ncbi:MAG TPA: hypothetical protein VK208_10260 [Pyrinomonadaceae bacterium]|nr:hypothetical protein [Pyrinomonadaceae bacterium]
MTQDASTPRPNPSPTTGSHQIPTGMWGGNHTVMQISPQGASVEFDCANGKIAGPMATDDSGHFDVAGTYSPEGPGPIREDKPRESRARYSGTVTGDMMLLTLRLEGSSEMLVSVSLTHGKPGKLRKCY